MIDSDPMVPHDGRYSYDEVKEILHRALDEPEPRPATADLREPGEHFTRAHLQELAAEVGISAERLQVAEQAWAIERQEQQSRAEFISHYRKELKSGIVKYLGAAAIMYLLYSVGIGVLSALALAGCVVLFFMGFAILGEVYQAYFDTESEGFAKEYAKWLGERQLQERRARKEQLPH